MIPEALNLRNFLSHRETELDLRGVHLASLVGDNGAGKSALLDAITWAVWGRSRAPYGRDEDLVYHGENDLEVEFVFRMPYQGGDERRFRILRRREQRGRRATRSLLDLQVEGENGWRSLNADSIRDTQARIIEQLGLDYETFINSAYLRQGHADEFTVQTPTDRKRVLSAILGLERWAEYQERARRRLNETRGQLQGLEQRLAETEAELARRAEYEAELAAAEQLAQDSDAQLQEAQEQANTLTRLQEQATALQRQISDLQRRLEQEAQQHAALEAEQAAHRARRDGYQALITQADTIGAQYQAAQETLEEERAWGEKLSRTAQLQTEKAALEQTIGAARNQLETQRGDLLGQMRLLGERLPDDALVAALEEAEAQLTYLEQIALELEQARQDLQAAEVESSRLTESNRQLKDKMHETKVQLDTLAEAEAACPLCRQALTPEHHARLLAQIQDEGTEMGNTFRANQTRLQTLREQSQGLRAQVQEHERTLAQRAALEGQTARLRQQLEQGEAARERLVALQAEVAGIEATLTGQQYAQEAQTTLVHVLAQLAELGYDAAAHEVVKARLRALASAESAYRELEKARVGLEGEEATLQRLAQETAAQAQRTAALEAEYAAQQATLDMLKPQLAEGPVILQQLAKARQTEVEARQRVGAARQNLAALATLEKRARAFKEEREQLATRAAMLAELRDAFGVNGIPAMIIEHTLPELEGEANRLLQRLTGGRMHVHFDTQRETKTGNVRETLDIIISDEKGQRPYENFSGGEQFRVNFAIRVALSRLLAQRAGVRLRSLFVDEGFGSLDADGRQRLVEAVKAVQADFALILVITHVDELRDAFPTRIQVSKTQGGSLVEVV